MNKQVNECVTYIRSVTDFVPKIALTLGSGLGGFAQQLETVCEIPYKDIPGFPVSTVAGHRGSFLFGYVKGVPVVCMNGRVHMYEGYKPEMVILPARVMHALGAEILFLTNAAGGIRSDYNAGDLVCITDHISTFAPNPLIGPNDDDEGVRFPDMSCVYDVELRKVLEKTAAEDQINLKDGVYAITTGPSFETPAEIRMFKSFGADLVGMSTVPEAIVARHMGMRVCGVSLVTNLAAGISETPLSHEEVYQTGLEAGPRFTRLVADAIEAMKDI